MHLLHVCSCKMFTFSVVLHETKQTLKSAQYGLEIIFNLWGNLRTNFKKKPLCSVYLEAGLGKWGRQKRIRMLE